MGFGYSDDICPACGKKWETYKKLYEKISEGKKIGLYMCECGHILRKEWRSNMKSIESLFPNIIEIIKFLKNGEELYKDKINREDFLNELEIAIHFMDHIMESWSKLELKLS